MLTLPSCHIKYYSFSLCQCTEHAAAAQCWWHNGGQCTFIITSANVYLRTCQCTHNNRVCASNAPYPQESVYSFCCRWLALSAKLGSGWRCDRPRSIPLIRRRRLRPSWTQQCAGHFYARSCINYSYLSLAAMQIVPVINPESAVFYERERIKQRPNAARLLLVQLVFSKWAEIFSRRLVFNALGLFSPSLLHSSSVWIYSCALGSILFLSALMA